MIATIRNSDESEPDMSSVVIDLQGDDAAKFAKETLQTTGGSRWESDGDDFAYCVTMDSPELLAELQKDLGEIELDDSDYFPIE